MIDYTNCKIEQLSVHKVGNKTNDEELCLSKTILDISDSKLRDLLIRYFLQSFTNMEFYNFTFSNDDFKLNPIFNFATNIFEDSDSFYKNSINVAKHLFETSVHPNIKSGDLFVVQFSDIQIGEELTNVVGIFKSENRQAFLKLDNETENFFLKYDDGINIDKLDKGCLIFDTDRNEGLKICIVDKSNKSIEAQYWKDFFLQLKPCSDNFHHTKEFLNITKNFVTKQLSEEYDISRTDKIDLLNRSIEYFKVNESFDKAEFEQDVFQDENVINSFREFDNSFRTENEIELNDSFEISSQAVKKQSRIFKSVLKLDKNFHVYIHGDKSLIEKGIESDGRKFYKIYYEEEN